MSGSLPTRRTFLQSATLACGFAGDFARGESAENCIEVTLSGGGSVTGSRIEVSDQTIRLDDQSWSWDEVLDVFVPGPIAPDGDRGWVELTGGDRLFGTVAGFDGETIAFSRPRGDSLSLPADRVRFMRFAGTGPLTNVQRLAALRDRGADDLALLQVGGRVGGELLEFDADAVRLLAAAGEIKLPRSTVRAVALSPELQRPAPRPNRFFQALLADGSHLTATSLTYGPAGGQALTAEGLTVPLGPDAIRELTAVTPGVAEASEPTVEIAAVPHGRAEPRRDRSVVGRRPVADGRPRTLGWGVAAGTTLTFAVPPEATAVVTAFAVDAAAGELADCDASITVDGATRWERNGVRSGAFHPVRIEFDGAESVALTVSPGTLGGVRDEAFWIAPRFVLRRR
ncbi:NPCBM/NEW2 domain-containing protein [Alienimonas chondri]|uniref:Glycosyl hydrolase family 98 putative carbohydrate-binding module domain-containing protein n=1 Tax=Alienimonas chondri TaxID=2681879 RepID=A0ABX1V9I7_9PLAN|nr:NPCBM/NEW2 domain-containing protein [Alienimonas chondri]NNJ24745.1 hypothetical protein [Alienimonas chondri]